MLFQRSYINALLYYYGLEDLKPVSTPMDSAVCLLLQDCSQLTANIACISKIPYQEAVGILIYTMLGTHSNIIFVVQVLSKFSKNPRKAY